MTFRFVSSLLLGVWVTLVSATAHAQNLGTSNRISFGLNGISDWSTQHPFIDSMKTARPWIGHLPNQWGGMDFESMLNDGVFDPDGWPQVIPSGLTKLETLIFTDQPEDATHLAGRYHLTFDGKGTLSVTGRGRVIQREDGLRVFSYSPGPGAVGIAISATDASDPIRNIRVIKEEHLDAFEAGAVFNPDWLDRLGEVDTVRFMDWMNTNDSKVRTWEDLPVATDFSFAWRGVPLSVMIDLANRMDADPWFTLPHLADNDLVKKFAETVKESLDPERTAHVEYSNEVWNFIFEQARWAEQKAQALWGEAGDGWMQYYGMRAAEVMQVWTEVYGAEADQRIRRVVSVHTGWPELEQATLFGDHARDTIGFPPAEMFDAYAVTGYFGYELGESDTLIPALDKAESVAASDGQAKGLSRVALREHVLKNRFKGVADDAAERVRNGSLRELTQTLWPYHAKAARTAGLDLIMYEGGTHAAPIGMAIEDERLVSFLVELNYSEQMGSLYRDALTIWAGLTDSPFNAFVDVAPPSQWGSWGALRHLNDDSPRWSALRSGMASLTDE